MPPLPTVPVRRSILAAWCALTGACLAAALWLAARGTPRPAVSAATRRTFVAGRYRHGIRSAVYPRVGRG